MTKFSVMIKEEVFYVLEIEANSEQQAMNRAEKAFVQTKDLNTIFSHVEERDVISVTPTEVKP